MTVRIAPITPRLLDQLTGILVLADDRAVRRRCRSPRRAEEPDSGARKHRNYDRSHICILFVLLRPELAALGSFGKWAADGWRVDQSLSLAPAHAFDRTALVNMPVATLFGEWGYLVLFSPQGRRSVMAATRCDPLTSKLCCDSTRK